MGIRGKIIGKLVSSILVLVMVFSMLPAMLLANNLDSEGTIKFGLMSDVHIGGARFNYNSTASQISKFNNALDWYSEQGIDALVFTGDMTERGIMTEWADFNNCVDGHLASGIELVASMGNHESMGSPAQNWAENFEISTGNKPHQDHVINGIHIISISAGTGTLDEETGRLTNQTGKNYAGSVEWLKKRLDAAVAEDPTKPIFVLIHYPIQDTYYYTNQSNADYGTGLGTGANSFLNDYPQVVTLSGHVHLPNSDPRFIWQGGFTAVNVADNAYHFFYPNEGYVGDSASVSRTSSAPAPNDLYNNDVSNGMIVEVDGSVVTIKTYDFIAQHWMNQLWTFDVTKPFPYTNDRAKNGALPVFKNGSKITASNVTNTSVTLIFDQPYIPAPNLLMENVHSYKFDFIDTATGEVVKTFKQWSDFMYTDIQDTYTQNIDGLTEGDLYEVRITPFASFQKEGAQYLKAYLKAGIGIIDSFGAESLTLTPGSNERNLNFTWYSDRADNATSSLQIAKKSAMTDNEFPTSNVLSVDGTVGDATDGKSWHKVSVTGLEQGAEYIYRVSNDKNIYSEIYEFKTGSAGAFTFAVAGDPQLTTGY
jgi:3',5'-cyclic AMP phosphodiesterase CpdA